MRQIGPLLALCQPRARHIEKLPEITFSCLFTASSEISSITMADVSRDRVVSADVGRHRAVMSP